MVDAHTEKSSPGMEHAYRCVLFVITVVDSSNVIVVLWTRSLSFVPVLAFTSALSIRSS